MRRVLPIGDTTTARGPKPRGCSARGRWEGRTMTPRVRTAINRSIIPGLVWGIGTPLLRLRREPTLEALTDGAILGVITFLAAFCLAFFFAPHPPQNSKPG